MIRWVRHPLHVISLNLEKQNPEGLVALAARPNEFGRLAQLILKFRETEQTLHQAEEQLRHSQKLEAVGRLAGGIAHDFNNLLTAIIGYSELIEKRGGGPLKEHAQLIRKAGEQAAGLTRQLLAFSRKQLLEPRVLDLNVLVFDMERLLQRVIGESIHIVIDPIRTGARVRADPNQLEQVLLNLGVNARDAMPSGGTLRIATQQRKLEHDEIVARGIDVPPGDYVLLVVSDTGSGMDDETRSRIFEPFFTTKGPGKGTGLGLATVYGIVKQSGGGITVESMPGQGCTFTIFLPATSDELDIAEPPPAEQKTSGSETILVVEDEEVVRQLICTVLGEAGYEILQAESPEDALQLARERKVPIHLLVTDIVMPGMNGPALARALSEDQPSIKILYVSGYSDNDISAQGVVDPGLVVLQKPFTQQSLSRKVRELLDTDLAVPAVR
jgi:signal transduction histidine kinase/CheY-like chemotaxis protein